MRPCPCCKKAQRLLRRQTTDLQTDTVWPGDIPESGSEVGADIQGETPEAKDVRTQLEEGYLFIPAVLSWLGCSGPCLTEEGGTMNAWGLKELLFELIP